MPLRFFVCFFLIHVVTFVSTQEDLSISNYSHIGCLILNLDKQIMFSGIQEDFSFPYQTFSSPNMTVELCFRLCRRWIILINNNQTNCICLHTIYELYEFNEYLGEVLSVNKCTSNYLQIYSLTKDPYILPLPSPTDDWSFEGCYYYLYGIEAHHTNPLLTDDPYNRAIDLCRKHCQTELQSIHFSFFLSLKKACYCLQNTTSQAANFTVVRKPVIHCSFLPYIKTGLQTVLSYSAINSDTVIKINVQRKCSSNFTFDRTLYLCLKNASYAPFKSYSKLSANETCVPILIKTPEQGQHFESFSLTLHSHTAIWIDRNSTYIVDKLFKDRVNLLTSDDLCLFVNKTRIDLFDPVLCSRLRAPNYVLCAQKPIDLTTSKQTALKLIGNEKPFPIVEHVFCPTNFVLFNNICYYVDPSIVRSISHGEKRCSDLYFNSNLVKFHSHEWGNVNIARILGRIFDDILLEFFYYQEEKQSINETKNDTNKKHYLRLLIGNKNDENKCILRYYNHPLGTFSSLHECDHYGGHPVCQCEPSQTDISKIIPMNPINNRSLEVDNKTESTNLSIPSSCDDCTNLIPDEDLPNNETNTESKSDTLIQSKKQDPNSRSFIMLISGSLLALVILLLGTGFLIRYVRRRRDHRRYSSSSSTVGSYHRTKSLSTTTTYDTSNTPSVSYTRGPLSLPSTRTDADSIYLFDDCAQLISQPTNQIKFHFNSITDDEGEPYYATLDLPNEK